MTDTTPKTPSEFVETMLRSSIEADRLADENINDRYLREAHTHTAVNGLVAAMAMEMLRRFAPTSAETATAQLDQILTAGDIGGPAYRFAQGMRFNPDQWIAKFNERAARRGAKPEAGRRAAHVALTSLAERWEQVADAAAPDLGDDLFIDEPTVEQYRANERAHIYRKAAADLRDVLRTGRPPHDLMTDAELEQHGTPEVTS